MDCGPARSVSTYLGKNHHLVGLEAPFTVFVRGTSFCIDIPIIFKIFLCLVPLLGLISRKFEPIRLSLELVLKVWSKSYFKLLILSNHDFIPPTFSIFHLDMSQLNFNNFWTDWATNLGLDSKFVPFQAIFEYDVIALR